MIDLTQQNTWVESNMGLVYMVAKKFSGRGVEFEDIVQIGSVGLIKAAKNFNSELGVKFSTYAVSMIIGEIKRFFRDDGMIKIPRKTKESAIKIKNATDHLRKTLGFEPKMQDVAEFTGLTNEEIVNAMEASKPCESFYAEISEDTYVIDMLAMQDDKETPVDDKIFLKEILDKLDARSRQIIILRFFKDKTQQEIADLVGVSQVQISRIEKKAIKFLRENFSNF